MAVGSDDLGGTSGEEIFYIVEEAASGLSFLEVVEDGCMSNIIEGLLKVDSDDSAQLGGARVCKDIFLNAKGYVLRADVSSKANQGVRKMVPHFEVPIKAVEYQFLH